jgi:hypothetical protein
VRLNEIYEAYRDRMDFFCVYIQEAHPSDGWQVARNLNDAVLHDQPTTIEERAELAEVCAVQLDMAMPMLLDTMSNEVDTAGAWSGFARSSDHRASTSMPGTRRSSGRWPDVAEPRD